MDHLYVRDAALNRIGEIVDYVAFTATLRFNSASNWTMQVPRSTLLYDDLTTWGTGIQVERDGATVFSGPIDHHERRWSATEDSLYLAGWDDGVYLRDRWASPTPGGTDYSLAAYDLRSGDLGAVMAQYVTVNAGPTALLPRQITGLTVPSPPAIGNTVTNWPARFDNLETMLQQLASIADIGFRVVQVGATLQFQVYQPVDRSLTARFSPDLGNLEAFIYTENVPDGNYGLIMGGGDLTARTFVEGGDAASQVTYKRRIEFTVDHRDTTDLSAMNDSLTKELNTRTGKQSLSIQPIDTPTLRYGVHYFLGDVVSVIVDDVTVSDVVRELEWTITRDDGSRTKPTIGTPDTTGHDDIFAAIAADRAALHARVSHLERAQ